MTEPQPPTDRDVRAPARDEQPPGVHTESQDGGPVTILVVDDDATTRRLMQRALARDGFNVVQACDGAQALALIPELSPAVVLMDVEMPVMNGLEACAALRTRWPDAHLPVLMVTSSDDAESVDRAYRAGATDFTAKPLNLTVLGHRVRYLLRTRDTMLALSAAASELDRNRRRLHELAFVDPLTELPNRAAFLRTMELELERAHGSGQRCALMFLDVDDFKRVNDTLGHGAGDRLLATIAARLRSTVRTGDLVLPGSVDAGPADLTEDMPLPLVARLGGDEFTVLLGDVHGDEDIERIALRIVQAVGEPMSIAEHELVISTSIGIAVFPRDGRDSEELLKRADVAMYRAKKEGKNGHRFHAADYEPLSLDVLTLEARLRQALQNDALSLVYQPQLAVQSGEILGMEALLRWDDETLGPIVPDVFIPIAESSGLIVPIGLWVLETACHAMAGWRAEGLGLQRVAVNISVRQFLSAGFVDDVRATLLGSGLPAESLELEITESLLMEDVETAITVLQRLKALGVDLAIDDFGTGYSSLGYLKRFPIDRLKIDRIFVRDILSHGDDAAITRAVIAMAHSMDLTVVAEGVESPEQLRFLTGLDCEEVQGYYLSRPLLHDAVAPYVRSVNASLQRAA